MCSTERKAVIYYFERVGMLYHWYMQENVKQHNCSTGMYGIKKKTTKKPNIKTSYILNLSKW